MADKYNNRNFRTRTATSEKNMAQENNRVQIPSVMRIVFGIIMIVIYVGMGILLLINFFSWQGEVLTWVRWIGGIMFIIYGIWRAIRQFWGLDTSL